ncbi:uncharacterized protein ACB058_020740 [Synchiropus picturatus]
MARPVRPASDSYQSLYSPISQAASHTNATRLERSDDEDPRSPIFSLSKSSMDVLMATGPPHLRDPAWTGMDLRRSSSTNTHSEHNPLRQLQTAQVGSLRSLMAGQHLEPHSPPALSDRWIANTQRWSGCSSTYSRSSTPDTIVWKGGSSRPSSATQETISTGAPDSPLSRAMVSPTTPSPFISPLVTPTLPLVDIMKSSPLAMNRPHQRDSPQLSPYRKSVTSQLPDDDCYLDNSSLVFQFPPPILSPSSTDDGVLPDPGCVESITPELHCGQFFNEQNLDSPVMESENEPINSEDGQELDIHAICQQDAPEEPAQSRLAVRGWRSKLISSFSDSQLRECCRCHISAIKKVEVLKDEATMTSQPELVDTGVQTITPVSSWWNLKRNTSNMGSHSILGSPPGSRLNLKSSMGSHSNLVSPSFSMMPVSSGDEDEKRDVLPPAIPQMERRRSCLKIQGEDRDEQGRRSSMKQVQWDEDGMTWDVHGASVDPEVLSTAIRRHLELQNTPRTPRRSSKKKKAPKPPQITNNAKAMAEDADYPDGERQKGSYPGEEREVADRRRSKCEELTEVSRRVSMGATEEEEVYGREGNLKSLSPHGSVQLRKKGVIRSLRPGWCGGSKKADGR